MAANPKPEPESHEYVGRIRCLECTRYFPTRITASHLHTHGLDYKGYQARHPGASLSVVAEVARLVGVPIPKLWKWATKGKILPKGGAWDITAIREYRDRKLRAPGGLCIPCLECPEELGGKRLFRVITWRHLRNKHGLTGREYLDKHPGSSLSAWADLLRQVDLSSATLRKWVKQDKIPPPQNGVYDVAAILRYKESSQRIDDNFSSTRREDVGKWAKGLWEERRAREAERKLPDDWPQKPAEWGFIGLILLQ